MILLRTGEARRGEAGIPTSLCGQQKSKTPIKEKSERQAGRQAGREFKERKKKKKKKV